MSREIKILQLADRDTILQYERSKLAEIQPDDFERQMLEWHATWRTEALEHYLPLGWSFGVTDDNQFAGYFLGQPQVFTRGLTQTLWIEQLQFNSNEHFGLLLEVAFKLCREKHFQQLLVTKTPRIEAALKENLGQYADLVAKIENTTEPVFALKTSKI